MPEDRCYRRVPAWTQALALCVADTERLRRRGKRYRVTQAPLPPSAQAAHAALIEAHAARVAAEMAALGVLPNQVKRKGA